MVNRFINFYISLFCVLIFMVHSNSCDAQNQIILRYGVLNQLPSNLPTVLKNNWQTSSNTFEILYERVSTFNDKYNINAGFGFSVYRFSNSNLFFDDKIRQSNYAILKYGMNRKIYTEKIFLNLDIFHYILTNKEKQDDNQRRIFANLEIGFSYYINKRFRGSISSPFTLYPMFLLRLGAGDFNKNEPITRYNSKVRNYGLNFGFTYNF